MSAVLGESIRVVTRVRPMLDQEPGKSFVSVVDGKRVETQTASGIQAFAFDAVLGMASTQEEVYDASCKSVLDSVLNGYNGAVVAYGQTASGKTHTMTGAGGVVPRLTYELFKEILKRKATSSTEYEISCSYIQLYREHIYDLLEGGNNVDCKLHGGKELFLSMAANVPVDSYSEISSLFEKGQKNRIIQETDMNKTSSRSHSVFLLTVLSKEGSSEKMSQLYLVDLAGSECVAKTKSEGQVLHEASAINLSLLSLRRVIMSLVKKAPHIPYRDSLLTRMLQSAIGGNSVTTIIICVSPSDYNQLETMSSLRFGLYTGAITNVAVQNVVRSTEELEELLQKLYKEIEAALTTKRKLEAELRHHQRVDDDGVNFNGSGQLPSTAVSLEGVEIPKHFICALSGQIMSDPVTLSDGHTYEKHFAYKYLTEYKKPPSKVAACVSPMHLLAMVPNRVLRGKIEAFVAKNTERKAPRAW